MQTMKHFTYIFLLALAVLVVGCSDNEFEFSENYDIPWKISTITAVSPLSAVPGVAITIQGENLGSDLVSSTVLQSVRKSAPLCRNLQPALQLLPPVSKHRKSLM